MALAKQYGSAKKARAALKKSAAGASEFLWRLKADESFPVRFLQEPSDWFEAAQHYVGGSFVWCTDPESNKDCEHCENGDRPAKRALANVLDRTTGKVRILQMTTQLANSVVGKVDRPITTADYEIWREGSDKENTKYGADRMDPTKCNISRYELHDIEAALITELGFDPNAEEEEDEPRSSKTRPAKGKSKPSRHEDEDDDYEDDEEDEVDQYAEMDRSELKAEIKKYDPSFVAKKSQSDEDLLEILRELVQDGDEEEDEDDDEDDEPPARSKHSSKKPVKKSRDREDGLDEFKPEKTRNPAPKRRLR